MGAFDRVRGSGGVLAGASPFSDQPGAPPPLLTGRDEHLRELARVLDPIADGRHGGGLFLSGPRGLGKTSLLVETAAEAERLGIAVVRVELTRDTAESGALLLAALSQSVGRSGLAALAHRVSGLSIGPFGLELAAAAAQAASVTQVLLEAAAEVEGGLLVLVDEAQEDTSTAAAVVRACHRAGQDRMAFGAVLAGLPRVTLEVVKTVSYAERWPSRELRSLSVRDAFDAIARPLAGRGVELPTARLEHVHTVTGGYPFFVQVLGGELWRTADSADAISAAVFNAAATATAARADRWMTDRMARVADRELEYLHTANQIGWPAATGAIADVLGITHQAASPARGALIDEGLLWAPRRGVVDLVVPPLASWLSRHGAL